MLTINIRLNRHAIFMFYKPKREISLGNNTSTSRQTLLEQTKRSRMEREETQRRKQAVKRIEDFYLKNSIQFGPENDLERLIKTLNTFKRGNPELKNEEIKVFLEQPLSFWNDKKYLLRRILRLIDYEKHAEFIAGLKDEDLNWDSDQIDRLIKLSFSLSSQSTNTEKHLDAKLLQRNVLRLLYNIYQTTLYPKILMIPKFGSEFRIKDPKLVDPEKYSTDELTVYFYNILSCSIRTKMEFLAVFLPELKKRNSQLVDADSVDSDTDEIDLKPAYSTEWMMMVINNKKWLVPYMSLIFRYLPSQKPLVIRFMLYRLDDSFLPNLLQTCMRSLRVNRNDKLDEQIVFCELYYMVSNTQTVGEFLDDEILPNIIQYSSLLSNFCYKVIFDGKADQDFLAISSKLLGALYSRDCFHRYCPDGHWLISKFSDDELVPAIYVPNGNNSKLHEVIEFIPFTIPFEQRVKYFRRYHNYGDHRVNRISARVRRGQVFEDGFAQLNQYGPMLKGRIFITFVDEYGIEEDGIDGGGVFKEFLTECLTTAFDFKLGLFQETSDHKLYPATTPYASEPEQLQLFAFLGRLIGKAVLGGFLIDAQFASNFLTKWLGKQSTLPELANLDKELYEGLIFLKTYKGDFSDLGLTMTLDIDDFGVTKSIELIPGGKNIPVTAENRILYIHLVSNYKLNTQIKNQCKAFLSGFYDLVDYKCLKIFSAPELQTLVGGAERLIDIKDLIANTKYDSVYDESHPTIINFWQVLKELDSADLKKFVKFVTSCSRPPLFGFKELQPSICVRFAGSDESRLRNFN